MKITCRENKEIRIHRADHPLSQRVSLIENWQGIIEVYNEDLDTYFPITSKIAVGLLRHEGKQKDDYIVAIDIIISGNVIQLTIKKCVRKSDLGSVEIILQSEILEND